MSLFAYPYPSYEPNAVIAGCLAGIVFISLVAWIIQSYQTRFQPRRLSILLSISHLTIFIEFISLFAIGQRMIIVSNYSFVLEIHHEKSCFSRGSFRRCVIGSSHGTSKYLRIRSKSN